MDGDVDAAIEYMIAERLAVSTDDAEVDPYMDYACNGKYLKLS
jgi:OTU domain-containing protein 3